ncbi:hypothetical protein BIW11_10809 [Tropilaelaps mercedesae]|uniref:Serine/threonine-protein kinase greatwall n=1 Tax=Tropilaelaps mercedesae TaxID=418985 RepID=A0A1V9XDW4_9ACAR|nr:hypothetical protein BIW11_10809 [Tropilaelaps mercedesae]
MYDEDRNLTKAAFASVANSAPEKVTVCKQLLRVICRRTKIVSLHNDPLAHFVNEQVHLTTSELLNKLENQLLSHKDIFDDCENLCHLFTLLLADNGPVCVAFSASIHQLTMAVAELSNLLERTARAKVVNWPAIGQTFVTQAKEANALQSHNSFRSYVPSIMDFDVICNIGRGTTSQVFAVVHRPTGHQFAMKITPRAKLTSMGKHQTGSTAAATQEPSTQIITETTQFEPSAIQFIDRVVGSMTHDPTVCRIHAVWVGHPDVDIALLEFVEDDVDCLQVVDYLGYMNTDDAILVIFQALLGIEHMHLRGFIHRDIKPSNFLIDKNGRVRLTDFVNSKVCRGHYPTKKILTSYFKRSAQEFKDHKIAGTLAYTAPEVLQKKSYGRSCDWWSLGASMYKLTTGKVPFRGEDSAKVKERIIGEELRWPKAEDNPHSATPEVKEFVYDLLKKNPIQRLGTKMYSDLKDHQAMIRAASLLRRVQTIKDVGEVRDARTKLFIIAYSEIDRVIIKNLDQTVEAIIQNRAPPDQSYLNFADLQDIPPDKHYRLLTFAHPKFRRFVDRQSGTFQGSDKYLTMITPPDPDLDYTARDDGETLLEATQQETIAQRMSQVQLLNVVLHLQTRLCSFRTLDLKLELAKGEGQVTYPVVMKTRQRGSEEDPTEVIFGASIFQ